METIAETQDAIVEELSYFDRWEDSYAYIIELGEKLPPMADEWKTPDYKVRGCQAQVWVHPTSSDGIPPARVLTFQGDSDAPTVKGLVALILRVYSGHTPAEILAAEPNFIERTGLAEKLSMVRVNGMHATVKHIKKFAREFEG